MDFHNKSDANLHPGKTSTKGMNPAPVKHHTSPAKEYPHGHAKKNK
jgi:hypothetical protein